MFVLQAEKKSKGHDRKIKVWVQKKRVCNRFFRTQYIKKMIAEERPFLKVQINLFTFWLMFSHMSSWKIHHFFFFKIFFFLWNSMQNAECLFL